MLNVAMSDLTISNKFSSNNNINFLGTFSVGPEVGFRVGGSGVVVKI